MNYSYLDLKNFEGRDDRFRERYFKQFVELVGQRISAIEQSLNNADRDSLWKALHGARPQLVFFGVPKVQQLMENVEVNISSLSDDELSGSIQLILEQMKGALNEINSILSESNHSNS